MIINLDFRFRDDMKHDTVPIEILLDLYKGVVYRYVKVGIKENNDDTAVLKFEYDLYEMGNHTETSLRKDKLFDKTLGLILNSIIVDVAEIEGQVEDEHRDDNSQEPNEERVIHKKGSAVST
jgi:hypothetical protein